MNRLRAFWESEPDSIVGEVFTGMLEYAINVEDVSEKDQTKATTIINKLKGITTEKPKTEKGFLEQDFSNLKISKLNLDIQIQPVIEQRLNEIKKGLGSGAALSVIFLSGSTLEGLLQDLASKKAKLFNQAKYAVRGANDKPLPFHEWNLNALINTAYESGFISFDGKKHSHSLRDFRNYIHARQQAVQNFIPDMHTAKISWQVLQAAISNLIGERCPSDEEIRIRA